MPTDVYFLKPLFVVSIDYWLPLDWILMVWLWEAGMVRTSFLKLICVCVVRLGSQLWSSLSLSLSWFTGASIFWAQRMTYMFAWTSMARMKQPVLQKHWGSPAIFQSHPILARLSMDTWKSTLQISFWTELGFRAKWTLQILLVLAITAFWWKVCTYTIQALC